MNEPFLCLFLEPRVFYARPGDAPAFPGAGTPTATDTDDFGANDQIVNLSTSIPKFGARQNVLLRYIMDDIKRENTVQETFGHLEEPQQPVTVTYSGADGNVGGTLTIANWQRLVEGHRLYSIRTGEIIRVMVTPTTSAVDVTNGRDFTTTTGPAGVNSGDDFLIMTNALPQGSTIGDAREHGLVQLDFQTGIIDMVVRVTGTRGAQRRRDGKAVWRVAFDNAMDRLNREMEPALFFGRGLVPTVDPNISVHPIHVSLGIDEWTSQLRYVFDRRINRFDLESIILQLNRENDLESWPALTLVCSLAAKAMISNWAVQQVELPHGLTEFGETITRVRMGSGHVLDLLPVGFLDKSPELEGRAWIFNKRNIVYRALVDDMDRDVRWYPDPNATPGNADFIAGRVIGEFGLEFFNREGFVAIEGMVV